MGEIAGVCRRTIQRWLKWYREGGLREMERRLVGGYRGRHGEGLDAQQRECLLRELRERDFRTIGEAVGRGT